MPSIVVAVRKAKDGSTGYLVVKNDGIKAENDKIMFLTVTRYYIY